MLKDWIKKAATHKNLRGEDYRVLLLLLSEADGHTVDISQAEIAQKLKYQQPRVCRALKNLTTNNIIAKKWVGGKLVGYHFLISESN